MFRLLSSIAVAYATGSTPEGLSDPYSLTLPYSPSDNNKWETGAGAKVNKDHIRLTPSQPSRTGYVWSRIPVTMTDWEVTVSFKVGSDDAIGGEGMAFWFVEKRMLGPIFGSADYWNGLGIIFDTYNNDDKGQSPLILAIYNDGTQKYEGFNDGVNQALGSCYAPALRGRSKPSQVKIRYENDKLTVELALDYKADGNPNFQSCISAPVTLGVDKFFGITAATGHPIERPGLPAIADNHDLLEIKTEDLSGIKGGQKEEIQRRREQYRREVEQEHKYMKNHHDVTNKEFKHTTIATLNQVASSLQVMEQSQVNAENQLRTVNVEKVREKSQEQRKKQSNAATSAGITSILEKFENTHKVIRQGVDTAIQAKQDKEKAGQGTGVTKAQQQEWRTKTDQVVNEMNSLRSMVQRLPQEQMGGARGQGGVDTMGTTVKAAMSQELRSIYGKFDGALQKGLDSIKRFEEQADDTMSKAANLGMSGGGGGSWLDFLLTTVLTIELIVIVLLQLKSKENSRWDHKRV